jgi:simple sugar transport system substrate-binding protein
MKKSLFVLVSVLAVVAMLAACAPAATPAPAAEAAKPAAAEPTKAPEAAKPAAAEPTKAPEAAKPAAVDPTKLKFVTVVKLSGVGWFNRMEEGVKQFAKDTGVQAFQQGPEKADAALQVQVIENNIAQKVDAINVVPFQPESLEPVLKKAMDQGIIVISHEASNQQNVNFDIEAFDNSAYGVHLMDKIADLTKSEGEYVVFVGSLTSKTHNEWVDAGIAEQKAKFPNMKLMGDKNESYDDAQKAYEKAKEILKKYPNLKGMQGSSANDIVGFGQAVEEAGLNGKIAVVGTSLQSMVGKLLDTNAVQMASCWDPALAGQAMNKLALMIKNGQTPKDGMDLGIKGYEKLMLKGKVFYGSAWIDITKDNQKDYAF